MSVIVGRMTMVVTPAGSELFGQPDAWRDSEGCWADVWHGEHREYLSCDRHPDLNSELGLCPEHEAKMQQLKEAS